MWFHDALTTPAPLNQLSRRRRPASVGHSL